MAVASSLLAAAGQSQQGSGSNAPAQQGVPDAPAPSAPTPTTAPPADSIPGIASQAARGKASTTDPGAAEQAAPPEPVDPNAPNPDGPPQAEEPYTPKTDEEAKNYLIRIPVNEVVVPVAVFDKNHAEVPGLSSRDFRVYENGVRQHIIFFSDDAVPLSVALVIDQTLPRDVMSQVNNALNALTGALTPQDEVAVFTYADGVTEQTTFTAATGDRLAAVISRSKRAGEDMGIPQDPSGPFGGGPRLNDQPIDPNLEPQRSGTGFVIEPKEIHTLNDAILAAGQALERAPKGRRRVIYCITDGKESRSKARLPEVVHFLQTNQETVYATLVGESAVPIEGYIDKFHLPLLPYDNIIPRYTGATGGFIEKDLTTAGMQRSMARIFDVVRTQYTLTAAIASSMSTSSGRTWM
jgi:VWFA-related protein